MKFAVQGVEDAKLVSSGRNKARQTGSCTHITVTHPPGVTRAWHMQHYKHLMEISKVIVVVHDVSQNDLGLHDL